MTVLVSVPYYRNPDWVEDSVRSILAQTHRDLVCVVVGDGEEPPLSGVRDSRLVVYTTPTNRGAYFAQMVALGASPHEWYAPVAADDWVDPDHIERLASHGTDMATGAVWYHSGGGVKILRKLYEVGMYRTERMLSVGGYNPSERLGQDSMTIKAMRIVAPLGATEHPTYHRINRPDSLCNHPDTKKGSAAREAMRRRNRAIVSVIETFGGDADKIREYRWSLVPQDIRDELAEHNARLSELL